MLNDWEALENKNNQETIAKMHLMKNLKTEINY